MKTNRWIITVVVLAVLAAVVGGTAGCGKTKEQKLIDSVTVGYDVLQGKVQLEYSIKEKDLDIGYIHMNLSLLNKSQSLIKIAEARIRIFDAKGKMIYEGYAGFRDIKPGETKLGFKEINLGLLSGDPKKITITLWRGPYY